MSSWQSMRDCSSQLTRSRLGPQNPAPLRSAHRLSAGTAGYLSSLGFKLMVWMWIPKRLFMKKLVTISALCHLVACGPVQYIPRPAPSDKGQIADLYVKGKIIVSNIQTAQEQIEIFSWGGINYLFGNLNVITESMVQWTRSEIKTISTIKSSESLKTFELRIDSIKCKYPNNYNYISEILFTAKLGNSKIITKIIQNTALSPQQSLTGCIEGGVVQLLLDPEVKSYLAE